MLDYAEYTIGVDGYQGNGHHRNGYDQLQGDWLAYYKVAKNFTGKVKPEDREDFLHDLFLAFAGVKAKYDAIGKELTTGGLVRIAQYEVADYWRKWYHRNQNSDCGRCSKRQRQKCEANNSYGSKCPKAVKKESLDTIVEDGNGGSTPLHELIADDKKYAGYPFTGSERNYYWRQQKKAQKTLV